MDGESFASFATSVGCRSGIDLTVSLGRLLVGKLFSKSSLSISLTSTLPLDAPRPRCRPSEGRQCLKAFRFGSSSRTSWHGRAQAAARGQLRLRGLSGVWVFLPCCWAWVRRWRCPAWRWRMALDRRGLRVPMLRRVRRGKLRVVRAGVTGRFRSGWARRPLAFGGRARVCRYRRLALAMVLLQGRVNGRTVGPGCLRVSCRTARVTRILQGRRPPRWTVLHPAVVPSLRLRTVRFGAGRPRSGVHDRWQLPAVLPRQRR